MKNVIFIVIDSFLINKIGNTQYGPSPTPFLDKLIPKSVFVKNLYAQGPYTEAGNKALLTGSDSLMHGGYMHNLNESKDIYLDVFKNNGYYNIEFYLPYYLYSNKHFKTIDRQLYTSDFVFNSVWSNRLKHFSDVQKQESLTEDDYHDVTELLRLTFEAWLNFFPKENDYRYKYISRLITDYPFSKHKCVLKEEYNRFTLSPKQYADEVLNEGINHKLFSIPLCNYESFMDADFLNEIVYKKYHHLIKKIIRKQFFASLRNQKIEYGKLISSLFNKDNHYNKSVAFTFASGFLANQYKKGKFCQLLPSCRKLLRGVADEMKTADKSRPIQIHVHPEELHNRTSFLTYDINDAGLLEHELLMYENYVNSLRPNYNGEIIYDLALLYVDDCIRELFEDLKTDGLMENTVFVITADHGYSYDCVPLREAFVNNHHTENYHIPAIFYDGGTHTGEYTDYHTSKDVLPTIYELCGIKAPESINGVSVLSNDNRKDYAISEYLGGGCPDMRRLPIHYMIRDKNWLLVYFVKLEEDFDKGEIVELYNLNEDPKELNNLKKQYKESDIRHLLDALKSHHYELQHNQQKFA